MRKHLHNTASTAPPGTKRTKTYNVKSYSTLDQAGIGANDISARHRHFR